MAGFGASLATTGPISGELMVVNDGTAPTSDGCQAFTLPANTIPLIDRGTCTFVVKVKNAQNAGAAAAVVANNIAGAPIGMGGADPTITIPSIMISLADANTVKPALPAGGDASPRPTNLLPDRDSDLDSGRHRPRVRARLEQPADRWERRLPGQSREDAGRAGRRADGRGLE